MKIWQLILRSILGQHDVKKAYIAYLKKKSGQRWVYRLAYTLYYVSNGSYCSIVSMYIVFELYSKIINIVIHSSFI
jgi:hypothetical protein